MTQRHHGQNPGRRRKILAASAAGLALAAAVVGTVGLAQWFAQGWQGIPYPVADPAATARELDGYTQSVYDALALPGAELADWPGAGLLAEGYNCNLRGMRNWSRNGFGNPTEDPGVVTVSDTWGLKGISHPQAQPALERVREELTRRGWEVTEYENTADRLALRLTLPGTGTGTGKTISVRTYPGDRLQVAAHADCARYPSGTSLNHHGEPSLPAPAAPAQLRE
ncbi:hypothetical protein [Streptomyces sp. NPDC059979]|uniref:hypothetical protein n=1 Tax=Streptomyces sp. NPDC059979 TaxID=3347021 RepID=UPI0036AF0B0C